MLPDPLHPALVHFPIVFTFLLPVVILGALWLARRNPGRRTWLTPVIAAAALSASAWLAVETGEQQEERVESAVAEAPLEGHEEAANRFLLLSLGVLGVTAAGGARWNREGGPRSCARWLTGPRSGGIPGRALGRRAGVRARRRFGVCADCRWGSPGGSSRAGHRRSAGTSGAERARRRVNSAVGDARGFRP